jgi:methionyl-tRNA formyltransferase
MRIVFLGSGAFGLPALQALVRQHDLALVVTQPDRPAGRRQQLAATPIARFADDHGLPLMKPAEVNDPLMVAEVRGRRPDALVVIAYGHKLGPALLEDVFAINLHASLLPKYRGAAPINRAMMAGERETGVSVITLVRKMDAGAILAARATKIDPHETAGELHDRLAGIGAEAALTTLRQFADGTLEPVEQDDSKATQAPKLTKEEGTVCFDRPADSVRARVHGLIPWPGCTVTLHGDRLQLKRVEVVDASATSSRTPGTILEDGAIACRPGRLRLLSVQPPGGKTMTFDAYRRGRTLSADARLEPWEG